ncbi:MAG: hypothetical protein NUV32_05160 [Exilispira sp.]|jgi:hypothetical protein|nr:hypothetical protein [Exilispira sp.]
MKKYFKLLIFLSIFAILHFAYDLFGTWILKIFSGTDESVFSHLKIAFWSYFFTILIDYFYFQARKKEFSIYSNLLINLILPWFIVIIWYIVPAIYGKIESELYEILWAFFVLILSGIFSLSIEKDLLKSKYSILSKISIIILFLLSIFFYTYFTFSKPWVDLFQIP